MIKIERNETTKYFRNELVFGNGGEGSMSYLLSDESVLDLTDKLNEYINKYNLRE